MKKEEILESLGLNNTELKIYLALLPVGSVPASMLGKRTGISRSTAQYACHNLQKKGLLKVFKKNNTFIYSPEPPEKLVFLLEEEKKEIEEKEENVKRIVGELKAMINPHAVMPKVTFYEGVEGLKDMLDDVLIENFPLYGVLKISEETDPEITDYLMNEYTQKRMKLQNPAFMLFNDNKMTHDYRKHDKAVNRISLLLPDKEFPFDSCCNIYGNKVAFYSYESHDLTGVLIDNEHVASTQLSIFKLAWDHARTFKTNQKHKNVEI